MIREHELMAASAKQWHFTKYRVLMHRKFITDDSRALRMNSG